MEELIDGLNKVLFIDDAVLKATLVAQKVAFILIPFFAFFAFGWNFTITFIRNFPERPKFFEWTELARVMILIVMVTFYQPLFGTVAKVANAINRGTAPETAEMKMSYDKFSEQMEKQLKKGNEPEKRDQGMPDALPDVESQGDDFNIWGFLSNPFSVLSSILSGLATVIVVIIEYLIRIVAVVLGKVLFAIGPLAVAFSIVPAFRDRISFWFSSYINVLLVGTTCNILNVIVYGSFWNAVGGKDSAMLADPLAQTIFYLAIIICYCYAFWLTSKYAGSNESGKVLMSGITQAATWAGAVISGGAAGAAAGAATKKGTGFESMVNTAKNITDQ